jgi:hypothetical protein
VRVAQALLASPKARRSSRARARVGTGLRLREGRTTGVTGFTTYRPTCEGPRRITQGRRLTCKADSISTEGRFCRRSPCMEGSIVTEGRWRRGESRWRQGASRWCCRQTPATLVALQVSGETHTVEYTLPL